MYSGSELLMTDPFITPQLLRLLTLSFDQYHHDSDSHHDRRTRSIQNTSQAYLVSCTSRRVQAIRDAL
jgi:hypothetical protein